MTKPLLIPTITHQTQNLEQMRSFNLNFGPRHPRRGLVWLDHRKQNCTIRNRRRSSFCLVNTRIRLPKYAPVPISQTVSPKNLTTKNTLLAYKPAKPTPLRADAKQTKLTNPNKPTVPAYQRNGTSTHRSGPTQVRGEKNRTGTKQESSRGNPAAPLRNFYWSPGAWILSFFEYKKSDAEIALEQARLLYKQATARRAGLDDIKNDCLAGLEKAYSSVGRKGISGLHQKMRDFVVSECERLSAQTKWTPRPRTGDEPFDVNPLLDVFQNFDSKLDYRGHRDEIVRILAEAYEPSTPRKIYEFLMYMSPTETNFFMLGVFVFFFVLNLIIIHYALKSPEPNPAKNGQIQKPTNKKHL